MLKLSRTKLAVTLGGLAVAIPLSAGVASAQPNLGPIINTTCSYDQVIAALNDQHPDLAAQFAQQRSGQQAVRSFLASSPQQRQATVAFLQGNPTAQAYFGPISNVASTCKNY
ncbi:hemophore-related protein [Mycolicibacterium baixiangningiae]|uniref:hemophore-related protein n=1 Tax=Mycolicibacterium baixiangningiae TaxID=2761578 RepID=UPI001867E865|nr:hemophore-related protein [Mycolicibacterium baixiangningiae]